MTDGRSDAPDRVHRWTPSRRQALAFGAGVMGGLAGCSSDTLPGGSNDGTPTEQPPLTETIGVSAEYGFEEVTLELNILDLESETLAGTLRLYSSPSLDPSNETAIAETEIEQSERSATHTLTPEWSLGYAQQLRFSIERTGSKQTEEETLHVPDEMVVPFYNVADGQEQVREVGVRQPPNQRWSSGDTEEVLQIDTEIWFNEPDEKLFNTPEVPESEYDPEWYPYRDIEVSVIVKYPSYENIVETSDGGHVPLMDAVAFTFTLGEWELLEAFRWNSVSTHKFEQGVVEYGDPEDNYELVNDPQQMGSTMEATSRKYEMDAASTIPFWRAYRGSRYTNVQNEANPLKAAAGRPITRRIASAMDDAFDNPSFNTHEYQEYHKAIALQVFIGWNPYTFATAAYSQTPEEAINRWFLYSQDESNGVGDCQDGTFLYCGIAAHLLDATPGYVGLVANDIGHAVGGLLDLRKPEEPFEVWGDGHPSSLGKEEFSFETEYGSVSIVECTYPDPIIGWKLQGAGQEELKTYLSSPSLETHIPLNDESEPAQDGGPTEDYYEIPWEFHEDNNTISDIDDLKA